MHPLKLYKDHCLNSNIGRTRFERLYLIGTTSSYLFMDALRAAIAEAKRGKDVQRFEAAVSRLHDMAPRDKDASGDAAWVEKTKKQVKVETDKMEMELKGYKNNLIRESIRVCYASL